MDGAAVGFLVSVSVAALLLGLGGILVGLGAKLGSSAGVPGYLMFLCGVWLMVIGVAGYGIDLVNHYGRPIDADHSYRAAEIYVGIDEDEEGRIFHVFDEVLNLDEHNGELRHILRKIYTDKLTTGPEDEDLGDCFEITPLYDGRFALKALDTARCGLWP